MAQNNLATQFQSQPLPEEPAVPLHKKVTQVVSVPKTLSISKFEKCLMAVGSLIVVTMMVCVVSMKIGVSSAQQHLQDVNDRISSYQNKNTNDRQTINELLNRSRLEKIAKQDGMTLSNSKIRNVNK